MLTTLSSIVTIVTKLHIFDPERISKDWSVRTHSSMIKSGGKLVFISIWADTMMIYTQNCAVNSRPWTKGN